MNLHIQPTSFMERIYTSETFNQCIEDNQIVAVHFMADWSGPCRFIQPEFERFATDFPSIKFIIVNIDENTETTESQGISQLPTFKFFKEGVQKSQVLGASEVAVRHNLMQLNN